jgi:cobalt-zinc-cadmium resistance protein CzcA
VRGLGLVSNVTDIGGIVVAERGVRRSTCATWPGRRGAGTALRCRHRDGKEAVLGMALSRVNENAAKTVVDASRPSSPSRRPRCPRA